MAQSDFNFVGSTNFIGGVEGTSALHALQSNPLTQEGIYCRSFSTTSDSAGVAARVKSTSFGGALVAIPNTKSVSVRAWLRSTTWSSVGISCKADTTSPTFNANSYGFGYHLVSSRSKVYNTTTTSLSLVCHGLVANTSDIVATSSDAVWTKVRMDVIPINGNEGDKIMIYTGTGNTGSEVWTLLFAKTVINNQAGYVPWNHATYKHTGFGAGLAYGGGSATDESVVYIDRFQALLVNA